MHYFDLKYKIILEIFLDYYKISLEDVSVRSNKAEIIHIRSIFIYLLYTHTTLSIESISKIVNRKYHTTRSSLLKIRGALDVKDRIITDDVVKLEMIIFKKISIYDLYQEIFSLDEDKVKILKDLIEKWKKQELP